MLKLAYLREVFEFRTKILSQPFCPQNFHLIDYNMLVFTVIILARRLIAAVVKEVRSLLSLMRDCSAIVSSFPDLISHVLFSRHRRVGSCRFLTPSFW